MSTIKQLNEMRQIAGLPPLSKKQEANILEARQPTYDPATRTGYNHHTDIVGVFCSSQEEGYSYFLKNKPAVSALSDFLQLQPRAAQIDVLHALRADAAAGGDAHEIQLSQLDKYLSDFLEFAQRSANDDNEKQQIKQEFDLNAQKLRSFIQRIGNNCTLFSVYIDYTNSIVAVRAPHPESSIGPKRTV